MGASNGAAATCARCRPECLRLPSAAMPSITVPNYNGGSLPNLVSELEHRLTGATPGTRLNPSLASEIPEASPTCCSCSTALAPRSSTTQPHGHSDGHSAGVSMRHSPPQRRSASRRSRPASHRRSMDSSDTSRGSQRSIGSSTPSSGRRCGANRSSTTHQRSSRPRTCGNASSDAGVEPITVQPGNFLGSPLSKALYRGCRIEPFFTLDEIVDATVQLAAEPSRFIFSVPPPRRLRCPRLRPGIRRVRRGARPPSARVWEQVAARLPDGAVMVGTADHGHIDFPKDRQVKIPKAAHEDRTFYGDGRAMFVLGEGASLADELPATWFPIKDAVDWWGPGPRHPAVRRTCSRRRPRCGRRLSPPAPPFRRSDDRQPRSHD